MEKRRREKKEVVPVDGVIEETGLTVVDPQFNPVKALLVNVTVLRSASTVPRI